jgi:hypothetical protein
MSTQGEEIMEKMHKKMMKELDDIISRAPDVDMEHEYIQFCENHEMFLWDLKTLVPGLLPRMILMMEILRFQKNFILGADVSSTLHKILNYAKVLTKDELVKNFSCEQRMAQMVKILENKGVEMLCEQAKRRKQA